jgi:hypothetical protein
MKSAERERERNAKSKRAVVALNYRRVELRFRFPDAFFNPEIVERSPGPKLRSKPSWLLTAARPGL